jgi:predicted transposase YbfD/YdcC
MHAATAPPRRHVPTLGELSAFATTSWLVLGQEAVDEKSIETTAIPALLERLDVEGALVSIDAMGYNPTIVQTILNAKADYLLAVKDNQPTLHAEVKSYFETALKSEVERVETVGKEHGRLEIRVQTVSLVVATALQLIGRRGSVARSGPLLWDVRRWALKFGPLFAQGLRGRRSGPPGSGISKRWP